jgi:N-acetylmuramoyl-L-alanine amidase
MSVYHLPESKYTRRARTTALVVHCADTDNAKSDPTAADVRRWHTKERGWIDGGYHLFIRKDGTLEYLRPLWAVGAHVADHNSYTIGVCLAGGKGNTDDFTTPQLRTLRTLVVMLRAMYPTIVSVLGHRDFPGVTKYCPSFDVRAWLKTQGL